MSRIDTNDAKRDLMSRLVVKLRSGGWSAAQLAEVMRVTPSTVNTWGRGESMGTNSQRAELAYLPATPEEYRERARELAGIYAHNILAEQAAAERSEAHGAHFVADTQRERAERYRERMERVAELFGLGD